MNWEDKGYLISKHKYNENSVIAVFYTAKHGKITGMIYGGTSKKIKSYLMIGNKLHLNYKSSNQNKLGYFNIEIDTVKTPYFLEEYSKLSCLIYSMNLIKILTVENQENIKIFTIIDDLFTLLDSNNWLEKYIFWELKFFSLIGYDLELKNLVTEDSKNGKKVYYVKTSSITKTIPNFLIDKNIENIDRKNLLDGFKLVGDFLDKSIIKPNNLNFPLSRTNFLKFI